MKTFQIFPILGWKKGPKCIPWAVAEKARKGAEANHYQSLEQLAERGGLGLVELAMALKDQRWKGKHASITEDEALEIVNQAVRDHLTSEKMVIAQPETVTIDIGEIERTLETIRKITDNSAEGIIPSRKTIELILETQLKIIKVLSFK